MPGGSIGRGQKMKYRLPFGTGAWDAEQNLHMQNIETRDANSPKLNQASATRRIDAIIDAEGSIASCLTHAVIVVAAAS